MQNTVTSVTGCSYALRWERGKETNTYKKNRDDPIVDFLPQRPYYVNDIKAIPRRYTNEFYMLFTPREEDMNLKTISSYTHTQMPELKIRRRDTIYYLYSFYQHLLILVKFYTLISSLIQIHVAFLFLL
jgi:hypothetical protein